MKNLLGSPFGMSEHAVEADNRTKGRARCRKFKSERKQLNIDNHKFQKNIILTFDPSLMQRMRGEKKRLRAWDC
jgi:hypothetical protein